MTTDLNDLSILTQTSVSTLQKLGGLDILQVEKQMPTLNLLVYGDPGAGKTVLAGSASEVEELSPIVVIDVEGGTFSLRENYPNVDVIRVKKWPEMQRVYDELARMRHPYRTVVLDSLTEMQKFSMYNIITEMMAIKEHDPDVPELRDYLKNIEQIRKMVRLFRDLPMNTIFTALAMTDKDAKTGKSSTKPSMSGKLSNEVAGFIDVVVYMYTKVVEKENVRLLLTARTDTTVAKDRSNKLPLVVENPTMQLIYNYIFNQTITKDNSNGIQD